MKTWMLAILCAVLITGTGGLIGALVSTEGYEEQQPSFAPPSWVFAPVWTLLYAMMGVSLALLINHNSGVVLYWFGAQLLVNYAWTPAFFGLGSPALALVVILALLGLLLITVVKAWKYSRPAVYLLAPYVAWVCFATVLNAAYVF